MPPIALLLVFLVFPLWTACGVKGDPIPYVQAYPEKPAPTATPDPTPTPVKK